MGSDMPIDVENPEKNIGSGTNLVADDNLDNENVSEVISQE